MSFLNFWTVLCLQKSCKDSIVSSSTTKSYVITAKWSEVKRLSRVRPFATPWTAAHQASPSMGFSRQEYWSGLPFLLQGIFLTQGSNLGLLHCRQTLYPLSHQGSPTLSWYVYPNQDANIDALLLAKLQVLWISPVFLFVSSLCSRIQSREPHCILLSHLLGLLWAVTVSVFLCFSWPWQFWGVLVRHFVELYSVWISPMFFSWLYWGHGFCPSWYIAVKGLMMPPWHHGWG